MTITLKHFLAQPLNFAILPFSHAVAHPLPATGEGMITAVRGYNPLSRQRERVGERGAISIGLPISLSVTRRLNHAK